jgi:radical SAM superfamily enzyme YgiQ (UPF0313 family)
MYNNSLQAERLAGTVKRVDDSIATIGGGSHFGALGQQSLRRLPEMDFVIEGEGELAFSNLLAALESDRPVSQTPRLHYREDGELRHNPPAALMELSVLPPMWSTLDGIIDLKRYARNVPEESQRRTIYIEDADVPLRARSARPHLFGNENIASKRPNRLSTKCDFCTSSTDTTVLCLFTTF